MAKARKTASGRHACVLVSVEIDGVRRDPYSIVELDPEQLKLYVALGAVDPSPEAVAHAESLAG